MPALSQGTFSKNITNAFSLQIVIPIYSTKGFRDDRFHTVAFYVIKITESQCVSILTPPLLAFVLSRAFFVTNILPGSGEFVIFSTTSSRF